MVEPNKVRPFDEVTVKCEYGKRLDCLSVTGAGLSNCRYSRYENNANIFVCEAGKNPGFYDDAKCVTATGTSDKCCLSQNKAGDMTIVGTDVHYVQNLVLPFDTYSFTARVHTSISKGKGARVTLICNSDTCANNTKKNAELFSLAFPESNGYVEKKQTILLKGSGDDRHYMFRISVDKGSEAYFDVVSMKNSKGRELIANGDFAEHARGTASTSQPRGWGDGDNRVGYYYGSVLAQSVSVGSGTTGGGNSGGGSTPPSGPTPTPGKPADMNIKLKLKLQGVAKKPAKTNEITVQVKLGGGGLDKATGYQTAKLTVDDAGIWSGTAPFKGVPTGGGYRLYVKGPKHIQKKICDNAPTESTQGTYRCSDGKIVLAAGDNAVDLSKIIMLAGDLPQADGKQNGIIDAYDTTFIRQNLGSSVAGKTNIGDLNYDGIIDSQDYSIVLQSLSIKYDEE